jgi:hypothetical protein
MICFFFSADEYRETTTDGKEVVTRTAPGMRLTLMLFLKKKLLMAEVGTKTHKDTDN